MKNENIRILIVDDHKIVRAGLRAVLETIPSFSIVGECSDGSEVLPLLARVKTDVILMDVQMKKNGGIDTVKMVIKHYPGARILMLSMYNEKSVVAKSIKAGALGFCLKDSGKDELIYAIRTVYRRNQFFSKQLPKDVLNVSHNSLRNVEVMGINGIYHFTEREKTVLRMIGKGMTNIQIGNALDISHRTVECHRHRLLKKIGVKNSIGLVKFATDNALID
ncbi:MAG: response regulator transcription factor [Bacteroidota bacterium]